MKKNRLQHLNTYIRRQDRTVNNDKWIQDFLLKMPFGVLATANQEVPYAKPSLFVYHPKSHSIYFHGADEGRTPDTIQANPNVCFTIAEMGRLLPAKSARAFSVEYKSVIVFGKAQIVEDEGEMLDGLGLLMTKYFPNHKAGEHYSKLTSDELPGTRVYRIDIQGWSGKQKQVEPEFTGAITYKPSLDTEN
jgi:nitroimidazol reductase NimA-like FMN-containing flavoprotein (pyridoxamine 5'-phosphate oxidase superfamily)